MKRIFEIFSCFRRPKQEYWWWKISRISLLFRGTRRRINYTMMDVVKIRGFHIVTSFHLLSLFFSTVHHQQRNKLLIWLWNYKKNITHFSREGIFNVSEGIKMETCSIGIQQFSELRATGWITARHPFNGKHPHQSFRL